MTPPALVVQIARAVAAAGGRAWVVGGSVRDGLLGLPVKDWDLEIHDLGDDALMAALRPLGGTDRVGRSFGVYKVRRASLEVDVALPRASALGETDPHLSLPEAMRRRDLTINAIALDPLTGELTDPFHGVRDLRRGLLRAVDTRTFLDDPLRVLRVMQFAARFGYAVTPELAELCAGADLRHIAAERVGGEVEKLLLKANAPSVGLRLGYAWDTLAVVLPELLEGPEANVLEAVDRAACRRDEAGPAPRPYGLMLGALLHALPPRLAESALDRLRVHSRGGYPLRSRVLGAVARWPELARPATDPELRRLAETEEVTLVSEVAFAVTAAPEALQARARADELGVGWTPLAPLLYGRDLLALGIPPGPDLGRLLSLVREAQIQGHVCDPDQALAWVRARTSAPTP